ncbi:MAG: GtrA family protein [Pontiella sp.]|nr:GtrA family protein [Pontiella sp.]
MKQILREKDHPGIQFVKYSLSGGLAFIADITVFYLLAVFVFPALTQTDVFAQLLNLEIDPISEQLRLRNFWIGKSMSFFAANVVAYTLNVLFVFKGGKHKMHHEIALFLAVSFAAFLLGTWSGDALIRFFGAQTTVSNFTAMFSAALINYAGRKFFIFHG